MNNDQRGAHLPRNILDLQATLSAYELACINQRYGVLRMFSEEGLHRLNHTSPILDAELTKKDLIHSILRSEYGWEKADLYLEKHAPI